MLQGLVRDIRFGVRTLVRSPGFTVVALVTMALGIGANTALFSVVNGVLLKPLPYPKAERIVSMTETNLSRGWSTFTVSPLNFRDWQEQSRSIEIMAAYWPRDLTYTGGDRPERLAALKVSEDYLEVLGGEPMLGRGFTEEDMVPDRGGVVILDHGFWQGPFGGDREVLGSSMVLDGVPHTIIGILPEGWRHPLARTGLDVLLPLTPDPWWNRGNHFLRGIGRMSPGVTVERAQADLSSIAAALEAEYPGPNGGWGATVRPLDEVIVGRARPQLLILLASVGLVLLIACVNVAQMTLARGSGRGQEMAIRTALGAGRGRVIRQLLAESLLLSLSGGLLGVLVAVWGVRGFTMTWPQILPRMQEIDVSGAVLLFSMGLALASGVISGILPAVSVAGSNVGEMLRKSSWGVTATSSLRRLRGGLVVVEVALAVVLLVGSGLMVRSFVALNGEDPGFETANRLAFSTQLPEAEYPTPADTRAYGEASLARLASIPGVESVALTTLIPVSGRDFISGLTIEGRPRSGPNDAAMALIYDVSPGYFETMGIPLKAGRGLTRDDRDGGVRVAVVSESFGESYLDGENPVGQRIRYGGPDDSFVEIVGVVGDVQHYSVGRTSIPQVYFPFDQRPSVYARFVIKASVPPLSLVGAIRTEIQAIDPEMPLEGVQTLEQVVDANISAPRFRTTLLTAFGLTALLLAAVGLYGVISYTVGQRSREFGMRMALGAEQSGILRLVLRDGFPPVAVGLVLGLGGSLALTRVLESRLLGVGGRDPGVFAAVRMV